MKTKQILMTGALALSMVLSGGMLTGCSNSSTKDTKTTEVAKKKEVKTISGDSAVLRIYHAPRGQVYIIIKIFIFSKFTEC